MSAPTTQLIASEEGEPFHFHTTVNSHEGATQTRQADLIPTQSPPPSIETFEPPFVVPESEPLPVVRSHSLRELAADEANRLGAQLDALQTKLKQIRADLADPFAVELMHSSDTERTIMRTTIGNLTESIATATRARKAALRRAGQRIGLAALSE